MAYVVRNGNSALVKCNFTRQLSQLTCEDGAWRGKIKNCSKSKQMILETM